jgi:DMSO/TMAO reductase YedYZ molybdopterin-dependent catalytic subunit
MMEAPSGTPGRGRGSSGRTVAGPDVAAPPRIVVTLEPYNAEAPLTALGVFHTPTEHFYARNHFPLPDVAPRDWWLAIDGAVTRSLELSLDELRVLPARTVTTTMECAGNDRSGLAPLPKGEPWASGAVSTVEWRGVALREVLARAGLHPDATELLFVGADRGSLPGSDEEQPFARSLPRDTALAEGTLLAYEMGGEPLPHAHGGPVRLLVPDWYGMASVKWLVRLTALTAPFTGHFQRETYVFKRPGHPADEPLRAMRVKSRITSPAAGAVVMPGTHVVTGVAWSGYGPITQVEVSTEAEGAWQPVRLVGEPVPHAWRQWEFAWDARRPGRHALRARATDVAGHVQPDVPEWNQLGYANNAIQLVLVEVRAT